MTCYKIMTKPVLAALLVFIFSGCGGSGEGGTTDNTPNGQDTNLIEETTLHGSVGDGPIISATISVYDKNGTLIGTQVSDGSAGYELTVRAHNRDYPLTIEASGGLDLVTGTTPDFTLKSVALNPGKRKRVNINPHSTLIVATAEYISSEISKHNIDTAKQYVLQEVNFGWDTSLIDDPINGIVDEANIAMVIKSSESLGEMIRRVQLALAEVSIDMSGDQIISAIAADLVDGTLDGFGPTGASDQIAAVANIISSQILLEAMRNELRVNGIDASSSMDDTLSVAFPTVRSSTSTDDVLITLQAIQQARVTFNAACEVGTSLSCSDPFLIELKENDTPQQALSIIPSAAIDELGSVIKMIAGGQASEWESVNQAVRNENVLTTPVNNPPTISGSPTTSIQESNTYLFAPNATDVDDDTLSFTISNLPSWASFNIATGSLSGTPGSGDIGVTDGIVISVTDGVDKASLPSFSITVTAIPEPNGEFSFTAASFSIEEGGIVSLQVTRTNTNGSASVNYSTYDVSAEDSADYQGTAATVINFVDGESSRTVEITTIDDTTVESNETFGVVLSSPSINYNLGSISSVVVTISDNDVLLNNPPTISGNPPTTVTANTVYTFTPNAIDVNGDSLVFNITNTPAWAAFDNATGTLSGIPDDSYAGTYQDIVISVSDGSDSVTLPAFDITVTSTTPTTGSATLSWLPPTDNEDGSALTDLAGYKVYYGTSPGAYNNVINIDNPGISSYVIENLITNNTYYFVMTAVNASGVESSYSNSVSKIIP